MKWLEMLVLFFMTGAPVQDDLLGGIAASVGEGAAFVLTLVFTLTLLLFRRGEE